MDTDDNLDQGPRRSARIHKNLAAQGGTSGAAQQSNNQNSRKRRKQQNDTSVDDTGSQSRTRAERSQSEAQLPANELSDIRQQRFQQIIDKLESYGLAREFDFMNEEERKQAMAQPWAKQKKLLTDRTWTNVEQAVVQYFREYQYQRSIRERLRILKSIVHDFELSQPMGAVLPGVIDFAYLPPIRAILQLPVSTQVTADHFAAFVPRMHDLATLWKKDMVEIVCRKTIEATAQDIPQIRAFLDAYEEEATNAATASDEIYVPSDKLRRTLNDAWTWLESSGYWYSCNPGRHDIFTCYGACGSPGYVCVVGFPRILTHRCMKKSRHWYNMMFEYLPEGDVFQEICYSELHERPLVNALEEIELNRFITENAGRTLFGTDDTSFRPQEWDDLDYRFTCEPCGRNKKCWHGMTWRRAAEHMVSAEHQRWRIPVGEGFKRLNDDLTDQVKVLERDYLAKSRTGWESYTGDMFSSEGFACGICRSNQHINSLPRIRTHLIEEHNLPGNTDFREGLHYYVHPDTPFTTENPPSVKITPPMVKELKKWMD